MGDDTRNPAPRGERDVEDAEDRFYTRTDPNLGGPLPPDPGTTPAELEESDAEPAAE
jgi:hypothetical protein